MWRSPDAGELGRGQARGLPEPMFMSLKAQFGIFLVTSSLIPPSAAPALCRQLRQMTGQKAAPRCLVPKDLVQNSCFKGMGDLLCGLAALIRWFSTPDARGESKKVLAGIHWELFFSSTKRNLLPVAGSGWEVPRSCVLWLGDVSKGFLC